MRIGLLYMKIGAERDSRIMFIGNRAVTDIKPFEILAILRRLEEEKLTDRERLRKFTRFARQLKILCFAQRQRSNPFA